MKKNSLALNSSCRGIGSSGSGIPQVSQSARNKWSFAASHGLKRSIHVGNSQLAGPVRSDQTPGKQVFDEDGSDVTPLPLYHADPGDARAKPGRFILDEIFSSSGSDYFKSTTTISMRSSSSFMGSSIPSCLSNKVSLNMEAEDSLPGLDIPINLPAPCELPRRGNNANQLVTEKMLDDLEHVYLSETDTISLLDIPNIFVSEDADDAETIKEGNIHYAELCKSRMGNDKYVVRSMQTFTGAPKNKQIQCDKVVLGDEGTTATVWDIYDSFIDQRNNTKNEKDNNTDFTLNTSKIKGKSRGKSGSSTVSTGSTTSSLLEMENCGSSLCVEPDPQEIMLSESFQHSLLVMLRSVIASIFQPKLAAYRQLPILEDPDSTVEPGTEEPCEEGEMSHLAPALERLWALSFELARGRTVTSMVWNKKNPDLLAVGYGDQDHRYQKPGLVCCWSLKNPLWPERVFHCHSCVTSLDFSANDPGHLAVGMFDGTVALYNVQCRDNRACVASSSNSSKRHLHPVWQVHWTRQEMRLSGEEREEALVSVSADGRITKWFLCSSGLDCIDLMELKTVKNTKVEVPRNKKSAANVQSAALPCLCVDFHPIDSNIYLLGTSQGLIHKCSFSNSQHFLDTCRKHLCSVNHVEWSPFSPDVFLSCSSDWTIQLWRKGHSSPVLSFTSTQRAVYTARWSPNRSTVFGVINGHQAEIWDLNASILYPTIVHHAAPGVQITVLLFATRSDCVLLGDSDGQATVYRLKNFSLEESKQVDSLEDIIQSVVSRGCSARKL